MSKNQKTLEENGWLKLVHNLPPHSGTDAENAYISEAFLMLFDESDLDELTIGILFIPWEDEAKVNYAHWDGNYETSANNEDFDKIYWKKPPSYSIIEMLKARTPNEASDL